MTQTKKKYQLYPDYPKKIALCLFENKSPCPCNIDFGRQKTKAIEWANNVLATVDDRPENPKAYRMGRIILGKTLKLCKTLFPKTGTFTGQAGYSILAEAWNHYFYLQTFWRSKECVEWLNFAKDNRIKRSDFFLPAEWPDPYLQKCNNFLEASFHLSSEVYELAKKTFVDAEKLDPHMTANRVLMEIELAYDKLALSVADTFTLKGIIRDDFIETCDNSLWGELGWAIGQLQKPEHIASGEKPDLAKVPILELIKQGESHTLEFKETLEYDTKQSRKSSDVLFSSLKTIAGFLNATGGTLLIGVHDSGEIKGIEQDLSIMKHGNNDRFQQKIRNCLKDRFEPQPIGKVNVSFEKFTEGTICRVDVQASKEPIHLDNKVFVREGNTTQPLEGRLLTDWIKQRNEAN